MKRVLILVAFVIFVFSSNVNATLLFSDDFNIGSRPEWGNEIGDWATNNGVYFVQSPSGDYNAREKLDHF